MDLKKEDCNYAACYCEENVYRLVERMSTTVHPDNLAVVFISNPGRQIPLFCQKAADRLEIQGKKLVIWDYHVILMEKSSTGWLVCDLDSTLDFPVSFDDYYQRTLEPEILLKDEYRRYFRVMSAVVYLTTFSSDRSHMLKDGQYLKPPPPWPTIWQGQDTLQKMIAMEPNELSDRSTIHSEESFYQQFHG